MEIVSYYEKYKDEHDKAKGVIDNWDCSLLTKAFEDVQNSLSCCSIDCFDDVSLDFNYSKQTIADIIDLYSWIWWAYGDTMFYSYNNLLILFDNLLKFDTALFTVYKNKPQYSSGSGGILGVSVASDIQYQRKLSRWKKSLKNLIRCCETTISIIEKIKAYLIEHNNKTELVMFFFNVPPNIDDSLFIPEDAEYDEFGCPLTLSYAYGKIFDFTYGLLPDETALRYKLGLSLEVDCIIDENVIDISGVPYNVYYVYDNSNDAEFIGNLAEQSISVLENLPSSVLQCVANYGVNFVFIGDRKFDNYGIFDENNFFTAVGGYYWCCDKNIKIIADGEWYNDIGILSHEFGHAYDNYLSAAYNNQPYEFYSETYDSLAWSSRADAEYLETIDSAGYNVDDYLSTPQEFFAESFSMYAIDNDSLNLTEYLGDTINELLLMSEQY